MTEKTAATVFKTPHELNDKVGQVLGKSDWLTIDQERINLFAEATGVTISGFMLIR